MFIPGVPMRVPFSGYGISPYQFGAQIVDPSTSGYLNAIQRWSDYVANSIAEPYRIALELWELDARRAGVDESKIISVANTGNDWLDEVNLLGSQIATESARVQNGGSIDPQYAGGAIPPQFKPPAPPVLPDIGGLVTGQGGPHLGPDPRNTTYVPDAAADAARIERERNAAIALAAARAAKRRGDFLKEFQGLGYDQATIDAELARLDALFANDWSKVDGSPWNYAGPQFVDRATGTIKRASSAAPAVPPDLSHGRYIINGRIIQDGVDIGPAPSVTTEAPPSLLPTNPAEPPVIADETNQVQQAGMGMVGGILLAGLVVGALVKRKKRPRGYTTNRRR